MWSRRHWMRQAQSAQGLGWPRSASPTQCLEGCLAAQSRQARPEDAQEPIAGTASHTPCWERCRVGGAAVPASGTVGSGSIRHATKLLRSSAAGRPPRPCAVRPCSLGHGSKTTAVPSASLQHVGSAAGMYHQQVGPTSPSVSVALQHLHCIGSEPAPSSPPESPRVAGLRPACRATA